MTNDPNYPESQKDPEANQPSDSSAPQQDPYGQPAGDPYSQYTQPGSSSGAYSQGAPAGDPYQQSSQPPADPFAPTAQPTGDPYGQAQTQPGQYGAAPQQGYPQPGQGGYEQQGYYQTQGYPQQGFAPGAAGPGGYPVGQPQFAPWGRRALGWLVNWFVPGLVLSFIGNLLFGDNNTGRSGSGIVSFAIVAIVMGLLTKDGQAPGHKIAKVQVVNEQGVPLTSNQAIIRNLAHYVDSLICGIGWLFPLWDSKKQTIADKIVKTYVIDKPE